MTGATQDGIEFAHMVGRQKRHTLVSKMLHLSRLMLAESRGQDCPVRLSVLLLHEDSLVDEEVISI